MFVQIISWRLFAFPTFRGAFVSLQQSPLTSLSLSITLQKELNKTKLVKTLSSTFYPFETLQIDEVALISLSGFVDKENSSLSEDDEDDEEIIIGEF